MERVAGYLSAVIIGVFLAPIFKLVLKVPLRIVEDAVAGWINRQISEAFGMTSPSLADIIKIVSEWGPAFLVALLIGWLLVLASRSRFAPTAPSRTDFLGGQTEPQSAQEVVHTHRPVKRDVWLLDAIHRVATGKWKVCDFDQLAEGKINEFVGVLEKIQQAAFDGDLPIWGKQTRSDVWRPIPPEYWEYHGLDWFSMLKGEPENLKTEAKKTTKNVGVWWELMTRRKRVDELWPTKTKDEALGELGRLREEGVHFRENAASQRILLQADLEKIKTFEAAIIENVEIISPGEVTNFRVIDTLEPARHPAHVQDKQELLLFSERLRRLGEFITVHSRR